jgi:hypothetical protein
LPAYAVRSGFRYKNVLTQQGYRPPIPELKDFFEKFSDCPQGTKQGRVA